MAKEITRLVTAYPNEFQLGIEQADGDSKPTLPEGRSLAYDIGRSLGKTYDIPHKFN